MKRGQIKLSFSMIFSIILIVIFLAVAFYAIRTFFGFQESAQVGVFVSDLQSDIDRIWRSSESSQAREYNLPSEINNVCFVDFTEGVGGRGDFSHIYSELKFQDYGNKNMMFYPSGSSDLEGTEIKNINLNEITKNDNPFCLEVSDGKLKMTLVKNFGEALVIVKE
ncbi:MAG: hypothetical protein KJ879_01080 [Nanoarchaeota archaeon]|nr:hypothetical protein [Nanoarchaeota archaeon]